jgi:hypothetical protein
MRRPYSSTTPSIPYGKNTRTTCKCRSSRRLCGVSARIPGRSRGPGGLFLTWEVDRGESCAPTPADGPMHPQIQIPQWPDPAALAAERSRSLTVPIPQKPAQPLAAFDLAAAFADSDLPINESVAQPLMVSFPMISKRPNSAALEVMALAETSLRSSTSGCPRVVNEHWRRLRRQ